MSPLNRVEVLEQPLRVSGDAQHPLAHRFADHREIADFALTIGDLLIGEDGAERFAPPDRRLGDVGNALGVAVSAASGVEFYPAAGILLAIHSCRQDAGSTLQLRR